MIKIKISKVGEWFIEISYNDLASTFEKSCHVFSKSTVDIILSTDKTVLTISFTGSNMIITSATLNYIDTTATTLEEFYTEIKTLL